MHLEDRIIVRKYFNKVFYFPHLVKYLNERLEEDLFELDCYMNNDSNYHYCIKKRNKKVF